MEQVSSTQVGTAIASSHVCPKCQEVGRVYRSWPRGILENVGLKLLPPYGLYRCHNCNWRGWKVRSNSSPILARLLVAVYLILLVTIVGAAVFFLRRLFPTPTRMP